MCRLTLDAECSAFTGSLPAQARRPASLRPIRVAVLGGRNCEPEQDSPILSRKQPEIPRITDMESALAVVRLRASPEPFVFGAMTSRIIWWLGGLFTCTYMDRWQWRFDLPGFLAFMHSCGHFRQEFQGRKGGRGRAASSLNSIQSQSSSSSPLLLRIPRLIFPLLTSSP